MDKVVVHNSLMGGAWIIGWLFTIGYLHLALPQIIYAVVLWPYYLGKALAPIAS